MIKHTPGPWEWTDHNMADEIARLEAINADLLEAVKALLPLVELASGYTAGLLDYSRYELAMKTAKRLGYAAIARARGK